MAWLMLLRSRIVWAVLLVAGFFMRDKVRDAKAKKEQRMNDLLKDKEDAQAIRDRVRDARSKPVQPDELKYRD